MRVFLIILVLAFPFVLFAQTKVDPSINIDELNPPTVNAMYKKIGLTDQDIQKYLRYVESPAIKYRSTSNYRDNPGAVLALFESDPVKRKNYAKIAAYYEQVFKMMEDQLSSDTLDAIGYQPKRDKKNKGIKAYVVPTDCDQTCLLDLNKANTLARKNRVYIYFGDRPIPEIQKLASRALINVKLVKKSIWLMQQYTNRFGVSQESKIKGQWFDYQ